MQITNKNIKISAPLSHVYHYISDIGLLYKEFENCIRQEGSDIGVALDNHHIFFFNENNEKMAKLSIEEKQQNKSSTLVIEPVSTSLKRFGLIYVTSTLHEIDNHVICNSVFISDKHPSLIWRLIIKAVFNIWLFQSGKYERAYIKRVEQSA